MLAPFLSMSVRLYLSWVIYFVFPELLHLPAPAIPEHLAGLSVVQLLLPRLALAV